jgi:hypothetical protein
MRTFQYHSFVIFDNQKGGNMDPITKTDEPGAKLPPIEQPKPDITLIPYNQKAMDSIESAVAVFVSDHQVILIKNDEDLKITRALWEECKAQIKQIDLDADPIRKPLREALDALYERIRLAKKPVEDLIAKIVPAIKTYAADQEAKQKEEARKLEQARLDEAAALEAAGKPEEAQTVFDRAVGTRDIQAPSAGPKLDQRTFGKKWFAKVVDLSAFYGHLAKVESARCYAPVDIAVLNRHARDVKGSDLGIPGVVGYQE